MITTARLELRPWRDADRDPWAELNADPVVMEHFPAPLSRAEADAFIDRQRQLFETRGWGLWAVDRLDSADFIGMVGLSEPTFDAPFMPVVEIGWRLGPAAWGHGFATEAAAAVLDYGFGVLELDEIVSFTATTNTASIAVMQRLGMHRDPAEDFDHPALPAGHRLERHVLYRLARHEA